MIECIFTIDYEIYGNGEGSLKELVYVPAERLKSIFEKWDSRFVAFIEVAELEMIESKGTDQAIGLIQNQIMDFYRNGFELGLHIHPWWYNALYLQGRWVLDYSEYNLCMFQKEQILKIVDRSLAYLRKSSGCTDFTPISFRAGHLLFQPAQVLATALSERGIKVDSSVYKGGLWHQHQLDYRRALRNGYCWRFRDCINVPDPQGCLLELPIYTRMVPIWNMFTSKRVSLQQKGSSATQTGKKIIHRLLDFMRFRYPLKFDLGQMTMTEIEQMMATIIRDDHEDPKTFRPVVVIMHTKDPIDFGTVEALLSFLEKNNIRISTLGDVYKRVLMLSAN